MRDAFFNCLEEIAKQHKDLYLLTGNLGFRLFDSFRKNIPDRFIDVGVAEANMIGISSGLALAGKKAYCYSIIPFLLMRAYEQIRMDIAYHNLPVTLVGVGGGFTYGLEGYSHFGLEDLALMRCLPNMTIVVPADEEEAKIVADISYSFKTPLYIRLGNMGEPRVHQRAPDYKIGKG